MIRIIIELIMFGCTVFTIIHFIKQIQARKPKRYKKTPRLSELKGKERADYLEDLRKDLK